MVSEVLGSSLEPGSGRVVFPLGEEIDRHLPDGSQAVRWECSLGRDLTTVCPPASAGGRAPVHSNCKNEYLVFASGEETAAQVLVDSIVWGFRRLKKPRNRETSASS